MRRTFFFLIVSSLLVFTTSAIPVSAQSWFPQPQKRLSIGGSLVDALADFQSHGGQVDEVLTPEDLAGKPPMIYGIQNGRSVFAISGGRGGGLAGLVTVDGSSVEASVTPDGFLELKPYQTGVRNRNLQLYRALFPDQDLSEYTSEAIFEYIDESGKRFIFGGSEDGKTTAFLFKKDPTTGEIVYKIRRDIAKNKEAKAGWVEPDESSTFPVRIKMCDENRDNCVVRNIIKKPGDEIRINPITQAIKVTFNKYVLPYQHKYGNAQRLSWACRHRGEGFHFTYREGFMGGDPHWRPGRIGNLSCDRNVLTCDRTAPGQKCNFDFRDYLNQPHVMMLFGLNWLTSRLDPHKQHFTITLDPALDKHLRVTKFENIGAVRTLRPMLQPSSPGNDSTDDRLYQTFKAALCPDAGGACAGRPTFSVLETTGVGEGTTLIDERTGVKLKNVTHATLYVLRNDYGTGKRGDFVGSVVDNRSGGAVISTLLNMEDKPQAPDLLDKKDELPPEDVKSILEEMKKEEEGEEIQRAELAPRQRALVLFPTRHGWGFSSQPNGAKKVAMGGRRPARVMLMPPAEDQRPQRFTATAPPPSRTRTLSRRSYAPAPARARAPVAPPPAYARSGFTASYAPPRAEARSGSGLPTGFYIPPTNRARDASLPRPETAAAPSSGRTGFPSVYRTASASLVSTPTSRVSGVTSARRRAPLRLPIWEEGLPQAAPPVQQTAFHPVSASPPAPAPAPPALSVVHSPPPAPQRAAPKPITVARAYAPKPLAPLPVRVTPALVREVQRRLKRQGYPVGRIDGRMGRKTTQSIRRFRLDVSLSPTGGIDRRLMASLGELERDQVSERTAMALAHKRRKGERTSRHIPYGYDLEEDGVKLRANRVEQAVVRRMVKLREKGLSYRAIVAALEKRGETPKQGGKWYPKVVRDIIERATDSESFTGAAVAA
ncbi:MAG: peptidoglycan-binding protein [Nitrospinae bacterium]|nr:peptidoglycan-binding protein [Nitrospinota bacterium]